MTFGVRDTALEWFASHISDRCQCVFVDGIISSPGLIVYGVPQFSVLGHAFFTMYSQPLSDVISAHSCDFYKYADDTEHSQSALPDEFCYVQTGIQTCIDDVLSWMNSNKFMLNTDKTEVMTVGTSSRLSLVDCDSANIVGSNIPLKTSVKYLGVKIYHTLSMQDHISRICCTPFLEFRHLASIRPYLSKSTSARLVAALILPPWLLQLCLRRFAWGQK